MLLAHSEEYIQNLKTLGYESIGDIKLATLAKSAFMNEHSLDAARLAAGAAIDLVTAVCEGRVRNGFGITRPPGHHAMKDDLCGFSLCNNIAIAARHALANLNVAKILIVDFDVHHGQGTQYEFYDDPRVLYASIHRYDFGRYWPHLRESDFDHIGNGPGKGFNINIPLNSKDLEDVDYLALFHQIILPVAFEFQPELVLVSAGFDSAIGCPEGEMRLSPAVYDHFLRSLSQLATGKVVAMLEGGYFVDSLADGVALSLRSLIGGAPVRLGSMHSPKPPVFDTMLNVTSAVKWYWSSLQGHEIYRASNDNKDVEGNIHVMDVVYEGAPYLSERESNKESYDPKDYYWTHSEEEKMKFMMELDRMRESYRYCQNKTGRNLAVSGGMQKHVEESRSDIAVLSSSMVSIIEGVSREEFDCAAAVVSSDDEFVEGVKAAASAVNKVMVLDLGTALGLRAREHFHGSRNVLCFGLNPAKKLKPKVGGWGEFDMEVSWTAEASQCGFLAALFRIVLPAGYNFDPDLIVVAVDENSPPEVTGHIVHQVQSLAAGRVVLATDTHGTDLPAAASGIRALAGAPLPPLGINFDSQSFGLVHSFAKSLPMLRQWAHFFRKLPDTFAALQKRLETRGNPFSTYTPQQYSSFSRTSISSSTYSGRESDRVVVRSEGIMADSKKAAPDAKDADKAPSPVKILNTGMGCRIGIQTAASFYALKHVQDICLTESNLYTQCPYVGW